jgi:hypothetical protein
MRTIGTCAPPDRARQHSALQAPTYAPDPLASTASARDAVGWLTFRSDCGYWTPRPPAAQRFCSVRSDKAWSCGMGYINF